MNSILFLFSSIPLEGFKLHLLLDSRMVALSCLERAFKCQNRCIIVVGCGTFSTTLLTVLGSLVLLRSSWSPPSLWSCGTVICAHQGQETFPFHELLHIHSYKGHLRVVWEWKIAFIKASDWDLRGEEFLILTPPSLSQNLCDFGGLPAPEYAVRSELDGCSHTGEASSFYLAAWECDPIKTLWWGGVCCAGPKGLTFRLQGGKRDGA